MESWTGVFIMMLAALLTAQLGSDTVAAQGADFAKRFLQASEGLQMPGSEADSLSVVPSPTQGKRSYPPPSVWPL